MTLHPIINIMFLTKKLSFTQLKYFYMEQHKTPQELLNEFCYICWDTEIDPETQRQKYNTLSVSFNDLSVKEKLDIIPRLVNASKIYRPLIFTAKRLFDALNSKEQHSLNIDLVFPSDMEERLICLKEYQWRCRYNRPTIKKGYGFYRPVSALDIMGFQANVEMIVASGSPLIILCS